MCSCCMSREKCKGDRKLRCWHPFKLPEHGFRETEDWKVLPREEETENLSVAGLWSCFLGARVDLNFRSPYQFCCWAPIHNLPFKPD